MGFTRFKTVFDLCQKIRVIMGIRDIEYKLEEMVEYDEAYLIKATKDYKKKDLNRGRGPRRKLKLL